ncbi:MAG: hypothetical protein ACJ76J_19965, partial [Thermoanaerobaculia bacterium]
MADPEPAQMALHEADHAQELAEDHHLLPALQRLAQDLAEEVPLARGVFVRAVEAPQGERRMAADLLEQVEQREDVDVGQRPVARGLDLPRQLRSAAGEGLAVEP